MWSSLSKVQTGALVALVVVGIVVVTVVENVQPDAVIAGLFGLANLLLGAGAVSHGVAQGSSASTDASSAASSSSRA